MEFLNGGPLYIFLSSCGIATELPGERVLHCVPFGRSVTIRVGDDGRYLSTSNMCITSHRIYYNSGSEVHGVRMDSVLRVSTRGGLFKPRKLVIRLRDWTRPTEVSIRISDKSEISSCKDAVARALNERAWVGGAVFTGPAVCQQYAKLIARVKKYATVRNALINESVSDPESLEAEEKYLAQLICSVEFGIVINESATIIDPKDINERDIERLFAKITKTVKRMRGVLEREGFWQRYTEYLGRFDCLRAYGIGSMESSLASRFQFSLLILLRERIGAMNSYFYDPYVSVTDIQVIKKFGMTYFPTDTLPDPERSKSAEFMFMPRCCRYIYEWTLANRVKHKESVFLSNPFSSYSTDHATWSVVLSKFSEEPLMIFAKDYKRRDRETRTARFSHEIPFEAFCGLAFMKITASRVQDIADAIECDPEWFRELPECDWSSFLDEYHSNQQRNCEWCKDL